MTKSEIHGRLSAGETLDSLLRFRSGQECTIFKADAFQPGDDVLYIPDVALNDCDIDHDLRRNSEAIATILDCCYTGDDFVELCRGNVDLAEELFWFVDWQHPSSAFDELDVEQTGGSL